jgi:type I restriction enzyme S subunit
MSDWPVVTLGDVFDIARGGSPRPIDDFITDDANGINWIMIGDAREGSKYITSTKKRIRREGAQRSRKVRPGDFLLTNSMSFGKPYIMRTSGCIHDGWLVLSPQRDDVDANFFYHLLGSRTIYAEFERRASGATVKNLNIDLVRGVKVALPPLFEQRRIAEILDKADALRAKRRTALAQFDTLTQSIFLDMFGDPIANRRRFPVKKLIEFVDPARPISYGILKPGPNQDDGVKYVRVVDMKNGGIELSGIKKTTEAISSVYRRSLLRDGDLLLSIRGHVGRLAMVPAELAGANITQDTARLALNGIDPLFVRECLRTQGFQQWMARHTKGVAVRGINLSDVKLMPIVQPSADQQNRFRLLVENLEAVRIVHSLSVTAYDALFRSLQSRAFRHNSANEPIHLSPT